MTLVTMPPSSLVTELSHPIVSVFPAASDTRVRLANWPPTLLNPYERPDPSVTT